METLLTEYFIAGYTNRGERDSLGSTYDLRKAQELAEARLTERGYQRVEIIANDTGERILTISRSEGAAG